MLNDLRFAAAAVSLAILLSAGGPARAAQEPFGQGFENWTFTQEAEKGRIFNCRAIRKVGARMDIMAMRSDNYGYVSVNANGLSGKFPNSTVNTYDKFTASVANGRLVFGPLADLSLDEIAQKGGYVWTIPGNRSEKVDLGKQATKAMDRVHGCIKANTR